MSAIEWGTIGPADHGVAGDATLSDGCARVFVTASPAGFPQVVTVSAVPALIDPGADVDDATARRDLLEVTTVDTYLHGADLADGDPFDSETSYVWPIDYWAPSALDESTGEPTLAALEASARAHVANLPEAWIDTLPSSPAGLLLNGEPFTG